MTAGAAIERAAITISLERFITKAWQAVEGSAFRLGWHIGAMAEHLEAVSRGQIRRLLMIVPPQCSKSILTGSFWPAWKWIDDPAHRWLYFSNSDDLALEESMRCRRLIDSEWYRHTFGIQWELAADQDTKGYYQNTMGGSRRALGFNANTTGKKGHTIVIDDPNDAEKVNSAAERKRVNRKYDNAISDRHIDLNHGATVIVAHRTHTNDLIGHCMEQGGWDVLHIREEFNPEKRSTTSIEFTDPRKHKGELLRPDDFSPALVREKRRANLRGYLAKNQGDPRGEEGDRFKAHWFANRWKFDADGVHILLEDATGVYRVLPYGFYNVRQRFGIVDPATSRKRTADYTAASTFIITNRFDLIWFGCMRKRLEIPDQLPAVEDEYRRMRMQWIGIEAVFSNVALAQFARRSALISRNLDPKGKDKLAHAIPAIVLAESGRIWLPDVAAAKLTGFPLLEVIDELTSFTGNEEEDGHDDCVDTLSYGVDILNQNDTGGTPGGAPAGINTPNPSAWHTQGATPVMTKPGPVGTAAAAPRVHRPGTL